MPRKSANGRREVAKRDTLNNRQQMFIDAYFACGMNGTEAALQAGYKGNRDVLAVTASRLLSGVKVRARIAERLEKYHLTANEVLARLAMHARGSLEDFIDADSGVIDMAKAKQGRQLHLVKKYKTKFTTITDKDGRESEIVETELELYDAQSALVHIGKHLGLFNADVNINFNVLTDDQLEAIAKGQKVITIEAGK